MGEGRAVGGGSTLLGSSGSWSFSAIGRELLPGVSITSPPTRHVYHTHPAATQSLEAGGGPAAWATGTAGGLGPHRAGQQHPGLEAGGSDLRPKENPKGEAPQEEGGGEGPREAHPSPGVPTPDRSAVRSGPRPRALEGQVPSVLVCALPSRPECRHFT